VLTIPREHVRLLQAMLNGGELDGARILQPETVRMMLTPQVSVTQRGKNANLGLVWFLGNVGRHDAYFSHGGAHMYGWRSDFRAYPNLDLAMCVATNRWDHAWSSTAEPDRTESALIFDYVAKWLQLEERQPGRRYERRPWPWKVSYAAGLMTVERLLGALSIAEPLTEDMVDRMVSEAWSDDPRLPFDPDGFRAGVADARTIDPWTPTAIRAFMEGSRLGVHPADLEILYQGWKGRGPFPVPAFARPD
jgi:Beta-lactamase